MSAECITTGLLYHHTHVRASQNQVYTANVNFFVQSFVSYLLTKIKRGVYIMKPLSILNLCFPFLEYFIFLILPCPKKWKCCYM